MPPSSSSVKQAKQALGDRLRDLRVGAGFSGRDLGLLAGWHSSKISKIEYGRQAPSTEDIRAWCKHCGAENQVVDLIASLHAVEGMFVEWQRMERSGLRRAQEMVTPLFERTKLFRAYDSWLMPGLLQTAPYTTALLEAVAARRGTPNDINEAVAARMSRQRVLHEGDHRFAIVIEESVLRSRIGGADTMAGQLGHLLTVGSMASVSLGIVPMRTDRVLRPVEGFWIFDEDRVNVELISGWLTITQPREVAAYVKAFNTIAAMAVHGATARTLITAAIASLDSTTGA